MYSVQDLLAEGFPHSEIRGSTIARISPRLIAACHVLHRLLAPRHPPNALCLLTTHNTTARTQDQTDPASQRLTQFQLLSNSGHNRQQPPHATKPKPSNTAGIAAHRVHSPDPLHHVKQHGARHDHVITPNKGITPQSRPVFRIHPKPDPHASQRRT
jgi:hypothetical protein